MNLRTKCAGMPGVTPTAEYQRVKSLSFALHLTSSCRTSTGA